MTTPTRSPDTGAALSVQGLWKIFGHKAESLIGTPDLELSRSIYQWVCDLCIRLGAQPGETGLG